MARGTLDYRPFITIKALQSEAVEGEDVRFELTRSGVATSDLTVLVNTLEPNYPHTNELDGNTTDIERSVTFLAGSNTVILSVPSRNDGSEERERDYLAASIVQPEDSGEYRLGTLTSVEVEIFDSVPAVTVAVDQDTIDEGAIPESESTTATFTLTRTGSVAYELTVTVRVDDPEMIRCFDHVFWSNYCPGNLPTSEQEVNVRGEFIHRHPGGEDIQRLARRGRRRRSDGDRA